MVDGERAGYSLSFETLVQYIGYTVHSLDPSVVGRRSVAGGLSLIYA